MGLTFLMNTGKLSENLNENDLGGIPVVEHLQGMEEKVDYRNEGGVTILICLIILMEQLVSFKTLQHITSDEKESSRRKPRAFPFH